MKSIRMLSGEDVLIAIREECPKCGAFSGEDCHGISGVVVNARIIPKDATCDMGFYVVHDERLPEKQLLVSVGKIEVR